MAMKKISGYWNYEVLLECPYCGEYLDEDCLLDCVEPLEPYKGKGKCPNCKKRFFVEVN